MGIVVQKYGVLCRKYRKKKKLAAGGPLQRTGNQVVTVVLL